MIIPFFFFLRLFKYYNWSLWFKLQKWMSKIKHMPQVWWAYFSCGFHPLLYTIWFRRELHSNQLLVMDEILSILFLTRPSKEKDLHIKSLKLNLPTCRNWKYSTLNLIYFQLSRIPFQNQENTNRSRSLTLILLQICKEFYRHKELQHGLTLETALLHWDQCKTSFSS